MNKKLLEGKSIAVLAPMHLSEHLALPILKDQHCICYIYRKEFNLIRGMQKRGLNIAMICVQSNSSENHIWEIVKTLQKQINNVRIILIASTGYQKNANGYQNSLFNELIHFSRITVSVYPEKQHLIQPTPKKEPIAEETPEEYFKGMDIGSAEPHKPFSTKTFSEVN
ncbi:MAG: hypothetical protein HQ539_03530 [Parcubacteria group bacterium]|nr:hypothetical protein [Parcubacteria group bacterium]